MTDNEALNAIAQTVSNIEKVFLGQYDFVVGDADFRNVTDADFGAGGSLARAADPTSVRSVVSNGGSNAVRVYENGTMVAIVPPGESLELPFGGQGEIHWNCATGLTSAAALSTYQINSITP